MPDKKRIDYASAGVDIAAGDDAVKRISALAKATFSENVLSRIGSFGGLFRVPVENYDEPVLVSSTDSVGTKVKLAFMSGNHKTVGQDLVNHCVNDILVQGALPLFFLDYIGISKLVPQVVADLVEGLSIACKQNGCALLGGETAELPGFYQPGEYDLVGCVVGIVERRRIIDGLKIEPGDVIIGLPSVGLHTNGYSLARKICFEIAGLEFESIINEIGGPVGPELMTVHKSYLKPVTEVGERLDLHGMAHITGGGLPGNLIRILPPDTQAVIDRESWTVPPLFQWLQKTGNIESEEMYRAFNMGIGYVLVVDRNRADSALEILKQAGGEGKIIGRVQSGEAKVVIT